MGKLKQSKRLQVNQALLGANCCDEVGWNGSGRWFWTVLWISTTRNGMIDQSQNPVSFNPSLCFLTHIKRGVRHLYPEGVKHRCGHGRCIPAPRESCGEFEGLRSCKTCHFTAGRPWASHLPSLTLCFFLWKYLPQRDVVSVKWLTWVKLESTRWKDCVFPGVLQLLPKWNVA